MDKLDEENWAVASSYDTPDMDLTGVWVWLLDKIQGKEDVVKH